MPVTNATGYKAVQQGGIYPTFNLAREAELRFLINRLVGVDDGDDEREELYKRAAEVLFYRLNTIGPKAYGNKLTLEQIKELIP